MSLMVPSRFHQVGLKPYSFAVLVKRMSGHPDLLRTMFFWGVYRRRIVTVGFGHCDQRYVIGSANVADNQKKLITISIPILNEVENLPNLLSKLRALADVEKGYDFEFLFTDNASKDDGFEFLAKEAQQDSRIRALRFSRNFGIQKSILTNYHEARGDAAVQIDADLQDPPELISDFLREWEKGFKVIYGIRRRRKESALMNWARRVYYWSVTAIAETDIPRDAGDFRLIDRTILDHLLTVADQTPYLRGFIADLGYPQTGIVYDREERKAGKSKFSLLQLVEFGIDGITAQSTRPLRLMTLFGFSISFLSVLASLFYLLNALFFGEEMPSGFATIALLLLLLIGLNSFLLGLMGEYVGRIFNNTRGLPFTIVEERIEPTKPED